MSEMRDIVIGSGRQHGADGYAGIVVDHWRIVSDSSQGVQDNSSLLEIQRSHPGMIAGQLYDNPNAASDHVHAYDSNGKKIKANGDPHIPTTGE